MGGGVREEKSGATSGGGGWGVGAGGGGERVGAGGEGAPVVEAAGGGKIAAKSRGGVVAAVEVADEHPQEVSEPERRRMHLQPVRIE